MKRCMFITWLLILVMLVSAAFAGGAILSDYATIRYNNTVLMTYASTNGEIVRLLPASTIVKVLGETNSEGAIWLQVDDMNGSTGYIVSANARMLTTEETNRIGLGSGPSAEPHTNPNPSVSLQGYSTSRGYQMITFGDYPTSRSGSYEPIRWLVLSADYGTALLLSEKILDCRPYIYCSYENEPERTCDFIYSDLYDFLNEEFMYTAFDKLERSALSYTERGYVFALSLQDFLTTSYGFSRSADAQDSYRAAQATPYAAAMGCFVSKNGGSNYWVASPNDVWTGNMHYNGSIGRANSFRTNVGVRVAVRVNLESLGSTDYQIIGFRN